jgi:hypothetical protein
MYLYLYIRTLAMSNKLFKDCVRPYIRKTREIRMTIHNGDLVIQKMYRHRTAEM